MQYTSQGAMRVKVFLLHAVLSLQCQSYIRMQFSDFKILIFLCLRLKHVWFIRYKWKTTSCYWFYSSSICFILCPNSSELHRSIFVSRDTKRYTYILFKSVKENTFWKISNNYITKCKDLFATTDQFLEKDHSIAPPPGEKHELCGRLLHFFAF